MTTTTVATQVDVAGAAGRATGAPRGRSGRRAGGGSVGWVGGVLLLPLVVLLVGAWLAGWRFEHVQTGSMEPTYPMGSLVVSRPVDAAEVQEGEVITFLDPGDRDRTVTHRVIEVTRDPEEGLSFRTQGDANPSPDPRPVPPANVQRDVLWAVPHLGGWLDAAQRPWGIAALAGVPVLMLVAGEVRDRRGRGAGADGGVAAPADGPVAVLDAACTTCAARIAGRDRYCRDCGAHQPAGLRSTAATTTAARTTTTTAATTTAATTRR